MCKETLAEYRRGKLMPDQKQDPSEVFPSCHRCQYPLYTINAIQQVVLADDPHPHLLSQQLFGKDVPAPLDATFSTTCVCGNHISGTYEFGTTPEFYCIQCGKRHPTEVFPPLPSASDLLHLDVLSTVEAIHALPESKIVFLRLEHP